jgi:radical SAM superfamily enzyme with C-terminal helix-hairpin-helix motif
MSYTILDCYTDEPSGLGVPPYLGTIPRYLFGALRDKGEKPFYLTIDDIRLWKDFGSVPPNNSKDIKTNIKVYNLTKNFNRVDEILRNTSTLIVVAGVNVPGKYLHAVPASLKEVTGYIQDLNCKKILTGPAAIVGSQVMGGKKPEFLRKEVFDLIDFNFLNINDYNSIKADMGAEIVQQIPWVILAEIELARGCDIGKCSFCTEPLKSKVFFRKTSDVIKEVKSLSKFGVDHFRFGKATCFYSYHKGDVVEIERLLKAVNKLKPKTFHIDNVNPNKVITPNGKKITELVVKYCTPGNTAAFGVESFDPMVVKDNFLNTAPIVAYKAVKIINDAGSELGGNGLPKFLPGINILFGLISESKKSNDYNISWLKRFLDEGLLLRRINVRQVAPYEGTLLFDTVGTKFVKKNKRFYWKWRNQIRQEVDYPMLKELFPVGSVLKDVQMMIYDGNTSFGRQLGTYSIVVGVKNHRLNLGSFYDVKVISHMLRSIVCEVV